MGRGPYWRTTRCVKPWCLSLTDLNNGVAESGFTHEISKDVSLGRWRCYSYSYRILLLSIFYKYEITVGWGRHLHLSKKENTLSVFKWGLNRIQSKKDFCPFSSYDCNNCWSKLARGYEDEPEEKEGRGNSLVFIRLCFSPLAGWIVCGRRMQKGMNRVHQNFLLLSVSYSLTMNCWF